MDIAISNQEKTENTAIGKVISLFERDDASLQAIDNKLEVTAHYEHEIKKNRIHFYFLLTGQALFEFGPHYSREISERRNYFFYNPERDLPFRIVVAPRSKMVLLTITLESLHKLFSDETPHFLKAENINRKFYDEKEIPPALMVVLNQLFVVHLSETSEKLYYQGKILELLSLYFSERKADTESCPFLNDEETVRKIKHAKEYLLKHTDSPPGLKELAKLAGLNEYQLKVGFKQIYGNTVFGFLLDHKLDHSRVLLDSGKMKVNEVAYQMGYTNPSHFIAAFKKKFGVTPKKYLMGLGR